MSREKPHSTDASASPARFGRWRAAASGAVISAVIALLAWTALQKWEFPSARDKQGDYYNLLAHGFAKGSLALDLEVPAALKTAENPWDSTKRPPGSAPADVTYFGGKFYLYFGVVPVVLLIWPFQLLTGLDLPLVYVVIAFCVGSYLWLARLWGRLLRDYFPGASMVTRLGGLAVLGIAGGLLSLARRASIWEMPIAAGQCFMAATVFAAYQALQVGRPRRWLVATGIFLGLAVGSRPTLAVAGAGMVVLVLAVARAESAGLGWRIWWRRVVVSALTAGVPLGLLVGALLAYNYARFGDPLEFGLNYQLTAGYEAKAQHFSLSYIHYNWLMYFWNSPQWGRDFPFVHAVLAPPTQPQGYYGYEYVYGALKMSPLLWFGWGLARGWSTRRRAGRLAAFLGFLGALTLALTAVLLCFNTAAARYTADFLPWWIFVGLLGWAMLEAGLAARAWWRRGATLLFAASALFTAVAAFCASVELHGVFRFLNPSGYASVARAFNRPVGWMDRLVGREMGAVKFDVVFPDRLVEAYEPLVTTGVSYEASYVFVRYTAPDRLRFGVSQPGKPVVMSDEIAFERRRNYRVRIETGALYPTREHPVFTGLSDVAVAALKDWVVVRCDDRTLIEEYFPVNDASPGTVQIGTDRAARRSFSGRITAVRRAGLPRLNPQPETGGDVTVTTKFPSVKDGAPQPLLMVGRTGNADFLSLRPSGPRAVVLGYESWSAGFWESAPLPVAEGRVGELRLRVGSMLKIHERSPLGVLRGTVAVWLDQKPVWWRSTVIPVTGPTPVEVGENTIGSNAVTRRYEGRVTRWDRLAAPPPWRLGRFAGVDLLLGGRGGGTEPLATTGASGRADTLAVRWLAGERAQLIYDHWGHAVLVSDVFEWPDGQARRVRLEMPSFGALDGPEIGGAKRGNLKVALDERVVWALEVPFYGARSTEVVLARNTVGSSVAAEKLSAVVLEIEQGAPASGAR